MKSYIGIDPGKTGGVAVIDGAGRLLTAVRMPKTLPHLRALLRALFLAERPVLVIEKSQPMPKQGVTSSFNYGVGYGVLIGMTTFAEIPLHEIRPADWKREILAGEPDKKDKGTSIRVCERLFPQVELVPGGCKKPQDGMAEAILLAEYGRRKNL